MAKRATLEGRGIDNLIPHPKGTKSSVKGKSTWVYTTFLLTPDLVEKLNHAIQKAGVGKNEFVRYALDTFCEELESGKRVLPVRVIEVRTIG